MLFINSKYINLHKKLNKKIKNEILCILHLKQDYKEHLVSLPIFDDQIKLINKRLLKYRCSLAGLKYGFFSNFDNYDLLSLDITDCYEKVIMDYGTASLDEIRGSILERLASVANFQNYSNNEILEVLPFDEDFINEVEEPQKKFLEYAVIGKNLTLPMRTKDKVRVYNKSNKTS